MPDIEPDLEPVPTVRPFLLTGGRVVRDSDLPLEAQVTTRLPLPALRFEHGAIAELAMVPLSVAEIAAGLGMHLGVVRVLVSEMTAAGYLEVFRPAVDAANDISTLRRVLDGLRSLG
jgi:Protein of unknown function (DUF742)